MFCHPRQIVNGKIDSFCLSSGSADIAGMGGAARENDPVKLLPQLCRMDVFADINSRLENNSLFFHTFYFTFDYRFVKFHVGDSVHQKSSRIIFPLEYRYQMSPFIQLVGRRQSRRAGADNGNRLTGAHFGRLGVHQPVFVSVFNNSVFIFLNRYRRVVQAARTGRLTRSRTDAGSKLRKIVRLQQTSQRKFIVSTVKQIVPFRTHII